MLSYIDLAAGQVPLSDATVLIGTGVALGAVVAFLLTSVKSINISARARRRANKAIIGDETWMSGSVTDFVEGEGWDKGNEAHGRSDPLFNSLIHNPKDFMYNSLDTRQIYNKLGTPPIITTNMKLSGSLGPCAPMYIHEFSRPGTRGF